MKKWIFSLMAIAILALALTGCGGNANQPAPAASPAPAQTSQETPETAPETDTPEATDTMGEREQLHFVYVSPLLAHPVWLMAQDGFYAAAEELGIRGDWVGPQNISPEEMTNLVETAIAQQADGVITQGIVPALPLQALSDAGIPFIIVDSDVPGTDRFAFLGKSADIQAELLLEDIQAQLGMDTELNIAIMVATLAYEIAHLQINAIEEAFASHPGGFNIIHLSESRSDRMQATREWESTFQAFPELNVSISLAAEAGPAAAQVAQEMNLRGNMLLYAVDDVDETLELIRNGHIDGSIVTSFWNYGYQATHWLYQHITQGLSPAEVFNDAGTILVNTTNVDTYADALRILTLLE